MSDERKLTAYNSSGSIIPFCNANLITPARLFAPIDG